MFCLVWVVGWLSRIYRLITVDTDNDTGAAPGDKLSPIPATPSIYPSVAEAGEALVQGLEVARMMGQ